jgi:hypothetical protein
MAKSLIDRRNRPLIGCATAPGRFALSVFGIGGAFRRVAARKNARNEDRSGVASSTRTKAPTVAENYHKTC